jgi:hypothetical protein
MHIVEDWGGCLPMLVLCDDRLCYKEKYIWYSIPRLIGDESLPSERSSPPFSISRENWNQYGTSPKPPGMLPASSKLSRGRFRWQQLEATVPCMRLRRLAWAPSARLGCCP